jgi:adenosylhomocysteine nucleosidase
LDSDRRVGVVVGLMAEARIVRRLGWPVAIGGGTTAGAESAVRRLIDTRVEALISFGLAGGLDPTLRPGALIVPSEVIVGDARRPTDPDLSLRLGGATGCAIVGANAIVASIEEKRCLYDQTSAVAIDLESGAVANIAAEYGLPFAVLRAICDPAQRALPPLALSAIADQGRIDVWQVITGLVTRPAQLQDLVSLALDAAAARRSLAARVRQIAQA